MNGKPAQNHWEFGELFGLHAHVLLPSLLTGDGGAVLEQGERIVLLNQEWEEAIPMMLNQQDRPYYTIQEQHRVFRPCLLIVQHLPRWRPNRSFLRGNCPRSLLGFYVLTSC